MKAVVYEGVGNIVVKDVPEPQPREDNVIVRVHGCAICGTDVKAYNIGIASIKPPVILGHEMAGSVVEAGKLTAGFEPGDRVTVSTTLPCGRCALCVRGYFNLCVNKASIGTLINGAFAEFLEVPKRALEHGYLMKLPSSISDHAGCLCEPLACVINGQNQAKVGFPDTAVVIGGGPLGLLQAEAARSRGAVKNVLVQRSKKRCEMAAKFKIDRIVCSEEGDPAATVREVTGGAGADVVINAAPTREAVQLAFELVGKTGRVSLFASVPKDNPMVELDANRIHYGQISVFGASDSTALDHLQAISMIEAGGISTEELVTHVLPLREFARGIELINKREALKVIIEPG
jgi:L-iditol 2-dehydrogenase